LALALHHPKSYSEAQHDAQPVLTLLGDVLGPDELEAAMGRGAQLDLEAMIEEILREGED
jgi:hypothetical protein